MGSPVGAGEACWAEQGSDALLVVLALLLVALNGLFVAAEFGLVKIRPTQVDGLVREGRRSSGLLKTATGKLDAYLSVCQLGITISFGPGRFGRARDSLAARARAGGGGVLG